MRQSLLTSSAALASAICCPIELDPDGASMMEAYLLSACKEEPPNKAFELLNENIQWERDMRQGKQFPPTKLPKYGPKPPRRNNQLNRSRRNRK